MPGLGAILSSLNKRVRTIQGKLQQSRDEIRRTKASIAHAEREMERLRREMETIDERLHTPNLAGTTRKGLLQQRRSIEGSLRKARARRLAEEKNLAELLSAREEEDASERLQDTYADALMKIHSLLRLINDGTVKYIFAARALSALSERGIGLEDFRGLDNKRVANEILSDLKQIVLRANADEKHEAERYDQINSVVHAVRSLAADHGGQQGTLAARYDNVTHREKSLVEAIAELEKPESIKTRRFRKILFLVIGLLILGPGVLLNEPGARMLPDFILEIIAFVLGGIAIFISWRNSDSHRVHTLTNQKSELASVRREMAILTERISKHENDVETFNSLQGKLKSLGSDSQAQQLEFDALLTDIQHLRTSWLKFHPEAETVL